MAGKVVKQVSGIDIYVIEVQLNKAAPQITAVFKPAYPTLIEITATPDDSNASIGKAIINDNNPNNNVIELADFKNLIGKLIWLRVFAYHPSLKNYDFQITISQEGADFHTYNEQGSLSQFTYFYRGFILKEAPRP